MGAEVNGKWTWTQHACTEEYDRAMNKATRVRSNNKIIMNNRLFPRRDYFFSQKIDNRLSNWCGSFSLIWVFSGISADAKNKIFANSNRFLQLDGGKRKLHLFPPPSMWWIILHKYTIHVINNQIIPEWFSQRVSSIGPPSKTNVNVETWPTKP